MNAQDSTDLKNFKALLGSSTHHYQKKNDTTDQPWLFSLADRGLVVTHETPKGYCFIPKDTSASSYRNFAFRIPSECIKIQSNGFSINKDGNVIEAHSSHKHFEHILKAYILFFNEWIIHSEDLDFTLSKKDASLRMLHKNVKQTVVAMIHHYSRAEGMLSIPQCLIEWAELSFERMTFSEVHGIDIRPFSIQYKLLDEEAFHHSCMFCDHEWIQRGSTPILTCPNCHQQFTK